MKKYEKQEYCSMCESVSFIDITRHEEQQCSECGRVIMPCSVCENDYECHECTAKARFKVDASGYAVGLIEEQQ